MRIDVERFLTITAMLAAGTAVALGCSSEDVENDPKNDGGISGASGRGGSSGRGGTAGTGGSSGSTGTGGSSGSAGSAGTAGAAGTGGTGGTTDASTDTGGTGGTAGADASACLGDTSATDAAAETCDDLPYASVMCGNEPPDGLFLCEYMAVSGRDGVFDALKTCLSAASNAAAACSTAHDNAVQACIDGTFPRACDVSSTTTGDGSVFTCADISAACEETDGGTLSEQECGDSLNAFTSQARGAIYDCWNRNPDGDCRETFETCVFDPDYNAPTTTQLSEPGLRRQHLRR